MPKTLALFDFDGTITTKDTFIEFIRYVKGDMAFAFGFSILAPVLIAYKVGVIKNWRAKEIVFGYFFKNMLYTEFQEHGKRFAKEIVPTLIRSSAQKEIEKLVAEKSDVFIISASAAEWIKPWSDQFSITILATTWQVENGKISGKIEGKNCYGEEKKNRILAKIDLVNYSQINAYGDTKGDTEMLALATHPHYRFFKE